EWDEAAATPKSPPPFKRRFAERLQLIERPPVAVDPLAGGLDLRLLGDGPRPLEQVVGVAVGFADGGGVGADLGLGVVAGGVLAADQVPGLVASGPKRFQNLAARQ